ncbi:MAG: hypothetical protein WEC59_08230 [Salibacteraceae bacterium]
MIELDIERAKLMLEQKISDQLSELQALLSLPANSLTEKIELLQKIRSAIYENLNQFQHENLIIKAAFELQDEFKEVDVWRWHPNQTGGKSEADLQGYEKNKIVVSAEITTSLYPQGVIDTRMKKTLEKLNKLEGEKFYVVQTEVMAQRARSKVNNMNLSVTIKQI